MGKLRFRKPNMSAVWGEIIALAAWLFLGDRVIDIMHNLVGQTYNVNYTVATSVGNGTLVSTSGCVNGSRFEDAYKIMGLGRDCEGTLLASRDAILNSSNGLLGIVALVLVVMLLMNFIQYK